jgi:hypothetical protein
MAGPTLGATATKGQGGLDAPRTLVLAVVALFFIWGGLTSLNDVLIPKLKGLFSLSYTEAMLTQFAFFMAYFIVSLPAGHLIARVGYLKGIVIGLGTMSDVYSGIELWHIRHFPCCTLRARCRDYRVAGCGQSVDCEYGKRGNSI